MINISKSILASILALSSINVLADDACDAFKKMSNDINEESPIQVDKHTLLTGVTVICSMKTVAYHKTMPNITSDMLRSGWQERKQAQWNAMYCEKPIPGWKFEQSLSFEDGERFIMRNECS